MTAPSLTDRAALARNRARAARAPDLFLHEAVVDEVEERLEEVNRRFTAPAVIGDWAGLWRDRLPEARHVEEGDVLALEPGAHDLVIHHLSLHWADDPIGQLVQCRHALRPDGLMIATLFGGQTLHELRTCLAEAEVSVTGGLSPRVLPMGEIRDLGGLLQRSGFALPVADGTTLTARYESPLHLVRDLRAMGEGNALADRLRHMTRKAVLMQAFGLYSSRFSGDDGRVSATFEIVTLTGWAPDDSQQKPLRPGSAKARLADALGTVETPLDRSND